MKKAILVMCLGLAILLVHFLFGINSKIIMRTESMKPTLKRGDLVILKKVNFKEVKIGDVICFKIEREDIPVIHRVVGIKGGKEGIGFYTKGDAYEEMDSQIVKPEDLLGRMIFRLPYVAYLGTIGTENKINFGLLIGLILLMIALKIKKPDPRKLRPEDQTILCDQRGVTNG